MTKFRPCIDLHSGQVKQIVGGTLTSTANVLKTNHVSKHPAEYFAQLYKEHGLTGGHMIMLGPDNDQGAQDALNAWPQGLHVGGGINEINARQWLQRGAEKVRYALQSTTANSAVLGLKSRSRQVIVTSYLFPEGNFAQSHLDNLLKAVGHDRDKLVIDLSCRRKDSTWVVAMNKWQTLTDFEINAENLKSLESYCSEFLIHAADNEGLRQGIDEELVENLARWCSIPVTYAGGGKHLADLDKVKELSRGKVDLTIGSALDIFGGSLVTFEACVAWNRRQA